MSISGILWIALSLATGDADRPQAVPLKDGDRIVLVGDTLIEREQYYGHFETTLLCMYPELKLTFRNLGWSGDTPAGLSRCYFDPPEVGFQRLVEQIKACEPTVLIIGYGMAHALEFGDAAMFEKEMNRLLDAVGTNNAYIVLLSTIAPDPESKQLQRLGKQLLEYDKSIAHLADGRNATSLEIKKWFSGSGYESNGFIPSEEGYKRAKWVLSNRLKGFPRNRSWLDASTLKVGNATIAEHFVDHDSLEVELRPTELPIESNLGLPVFIGLPKGKYEITIGEETFDQQQSEAGTIAHSSGAVLAWQDQYEMVRQLIIRKNALYFQRYRPQNITYLLGFRAYEQGQNAKEIEALDPMIAELEKKIDELKVPKPLKAKITRVK